MTTPIAARTPRMERHGAGRPSFTDVACFATQSAPYAKVLRSLDRLALYDDALILLEGEPGTGKTLLARRLHQLSRRVEGVFHRVDLGALDDGISGSDLFGHVSGAFTGAQSRRVGHFLSAHGGTLFLDELAKASRSVQQKLLHALEYREVTPVGAERPVTIDVRVVAATNVSLEDRVEKGEFLEDLLPRFGHFRLRIPALRERAADIVPLAQHFLSLHAPRFGYRADPPSISEDLRAALTESPWPGNVRELDSAIRYLLVAGEGDDVLDLRHCTGSLRALRQRVKVERFGLTPERVRGAVQSAGSISAAARELRTSRPTVYRYLRQEPTPPTP